MKRTLVAAVAAAGLAVGGCDYITSSADGGNVTLGFSTTSTDVASSANAGATLSLVAPDERHQLELAGDNGTLTITAIAFIVDEFRLERADATCGEPNGDDDDDCLTFETGVAFVELPLDGSTTPVVTQEVAPGTYVSLKLETDDADLDEAADDDESAEITALIEAIEAAGYENWPADASLIVVGTFTPAEGEARDFTAYFEAEIKVEMALDPALKIEGESGTVDIEIDPAAWYTNADGTVVDLSAYDYGTTNEVVEFEAKMVDGFRKVELEGFDD